MLYIVKCVETSHYILVGFIDSIHIDIIIINEKLC